ncbi:MAG: Gfo/Idh/MocA family oxidoreductase [Pseudomonadota bacterium]
MVGFGVIGGGMIAPIHIAAIAKLDGAELRGAMDNGSGRAEQMAPGLDHRGSDDLRKFLARDDIDVVCIATPSGSHADIAIQAANAGKHCIVEKPIDISLERIDRMIAAHEASGTRLGGIFNTRYAPSAALIKDAVEAGRFGQLTFASAMGPWWRDQSYYDDSDWKGTWRLDGGGALMNQGIHSIDLLQWFVDEPVVSVNGRIATLAHQNMETEDTGAATLTFANGALGNIACTTSMWPGHFRTISIAGSDGTAVLADNALLFWQFREETSADDDIRRDMLQIPGQGVGASDPAAGVDEAGHHAVFREFLDALNAGVEPRINGAESRKAVSLILAIYESSQKNGAPVAPR